MLSAALSLVSCAYCPSTLFRWERPSFRPDQSRAARDAYSVRQLPGNLLRESEGPYDLSIATIIASHRRRKTRTT